MQRSDSFKQSDRGGFVRAPREFPEAAFGGDAQRRSVFGFDHTDGAGRPVPRIHPRKRGPCSLRRIAFAVGFQRQHPSHFRITAKIGRHLPPEIAEANLANKSASEFLANDPKAEIKKLPVAHMTQKTQPRFFARKRSPPNMADD